MIIELQNELETFLNDYANNDVIIIPVFCDTTHHPANNLLSFLFVKFLGKSEYYILPFNHNECINLSTNVLDKLNLDNKKFVFDKKEFLHTFHFKNLIDVRSIHYINTNKNDESICTLDIILPKSYSLIYKFFSNTINIGKALPILQYYSNLVSISNSLEYVINTNSNSELENSFKFLNSDTICCLYNIEKEGLYVNKRLVEKFFPNSVNHISKNNTFHTQYNIYTLTGRPSNKFSNINFAALHKKNGERECFITRFGEFGDLLLFDYDAYHLRLMADIVDYTFPDGINIHEYLGKIYFEKTDLTEDDYNESKSVSFEILYGGIDESVSKEIPFFNFVKKFVDSTWETAQERGYAEAIISKKKLFLKNFDSLNKNKLFNYILQNYETVSNVLVMHDIQSFLIKNGYKSKLILYLYDGFLFDIHSDDNNILFEIKQILQRNGKYPVKTYKGKDFQNMLKIE